MHPMKGPMTTQTLKGLAGMPPLHWRGDRASFEAFNPAFDTLMGGPQLPAADMTAYREFTETIQFPPNPNQTLDRNLPSSITGGDPTAGQHTFLTEPYTAGNVTCVQCHLTISGTDRTMSPKILLQESQDFKVPQLRNLYKKTFFNDTPGATSLDGFGFSHDGTDPSLFRFLSHPTFPFIQNDTTRKTNLSAFLMCFDTGTAPAVGYSRTITATNVNDSALNTDWTLLQNQAAASNIDLIAKGTIDGKRHGLFYQPGSGTYASDKTGLGPYTQAQLKTKIQNGDRLTFMGVPPGSGMRMGIDRDLNGELDGEGPPFISYNSWTGYWLTPGETSDPNIGGLTADSDRDGLPNLMEYALNLRPKFSDVIGTPTPQFSGNARSLVYTKILDSTDLDYAVYESTNLQSWQPASVTNEVLADDGRQQTIRATMTNSSAKFLQLRVTKH